MSERISGADVRKMGCSFWGYYCVNHRIVTDSNLNELAAQVDRDADLAARLAAAERERDEWKARASVHIPVDAATRADAEQWRAFEACRDHEMRFKGYGFGAEGNAAGKRGVMCWTEPLGTTIAEAPDFPALLARLDALRPEPEVWRVRFPDGLVTAVTYPTAAACRAGIPIGGCTPVRETKNPDGSILLTPEAT